MTMYNKNSNILRGFILMMAERPNKLSAQSRYLSGPFR